jgi:hypothetical protein
MKVEISDVKVVEEAYVGPDGTLPQLPKFSGHKINIVVLNEKKEQAPKAEIETDSGISIPNTRNKERMEFFDFLSKQGINVVNSGLRKILNGQTFVIRSSKRHYREDMEFNYVLWYKFTFSELWSIYGLDDSYHFGLIDREDKTIYKIPAKEVISLFQEAAKIHRDALQLHILVYDDKFVFRVNTQRGEENLDKEFPREDYVLTWEDFAKTLVGN